ncbi:hypothetical protein NDU88_002115 [Pleurodeles waltl]|uniref:Uncharacterized protein n=1 Tax=Pleurodeles waltl TaxID=8319 RepID=A0AAV7M2F0_PLEWA|nr:hypothetical protein NDU88_002115 [Pleurodeles waltl]
MLQSCHPSLQARNIGSHGFGLQGQGGYGSIHPLYLAADGGDLRTGGGGGAQTSRHSSLPLFCAELVTTIVCSGRLISPVWRVAMRDMSRDGDTGVGPVRFRGPGDGVVLSGNYDVPLKPMRWKLSRTCSFVFSACSGEAWDRDILKGEDGKSKASAY